MAVKVRDEMQGLLGCLPVRELATRTYRRVLDNEILLRASAASYYALMALVPFLAVVLTLAAHLAPDLTNQAESAKALGQMTVEEFQTTLARFLPEAAFHVVASEISRIQKAPPVGLLSVGLVASLWLASSLFRTVISTLNRIYEVDESRPFWHLAFTALCITLIQSMVILGTLVVLVIWPQMRGWLGFTHEPGSGRLIAEWFILAVGVLMSFAVIGYMGPNVEKKWKWITPGSLIGTFVFVVASIGFRIYVQEFGNYGKTYGSLAGVMLLLLWFWIAATILLVGIQIDQVIQEERGDMR